ncbi:hypothetical protein ACC717_09515 [Rhizobium ruizarguesonis]
MTERDRLLQSIATITADYRAGELAAPSPQHVDRWVSQFPQAVQQPILAELEHVFGETYIAKKDVEKFLSTLVKSEKIAGADPASFWRNVKFLNIQGAGNSQREMLEIFGEKLQKHYDIEISDCRESPTAFVYLDDVVFTGGRVRTDLTSWINTSAPPETTVHIITMGLHNGGNWYANQEIAKVAKAAEKSIKLQWWRGVQIEDRKSHTDTSDVLRPTMIPNDPVTQAYINSLGFAPVLRQPGSVGVKKFFSSEEGRSLVEQEFLKIGAHIRTIAPNLGIYQRPLGNMVLKTPGFGSMIVTFRNCPNNAPLALWVGAPWYPLFARKNN